MGNDVFISSTHKMKVTIVTIKGILLKLYIEILVGDFTQKGGISSLSSLFRVEARDCQDVIRELRKD